MTQQEAAPELTTCTSDFLRELREQLFKIKPIPVDAVIECEALEETIDDFRDGAVEPRVVIRGAIKLYMNHSSELRGREAAHVIDRFSYGFGELAGIKRDVVTEWWMTIRETES